RVSQWSAAAAAQRRPTSRPFVPSSSDGIIGAISPMRQRRKQRGSRRPAYQARPSQKGHRLVLVLIETELTQTDDLEQRTQLRADLFFAHHRRTGRVRLARVAGQDEPDRP